MFAVPVEYGVVHLSFENGSSFLLSGSVALSVGYVTCELISLLVGALTLTSTRCDHCLPLLLCLLGAVCIVLCFMLWVVVCMGGT